MHILHCLALISQWDWQKGNGEKGRKGRTEALLHVLTSELSPFRKGFRTRRLTEHCRRRRGESPQISAAVLFYRIQKKGKKKNNKEKKNTGIQTPWITLSSYDFRLLRLKALAASDSGETAGEKTPHICGVFTPVFSIVFLPS